MPIIREATIEDLPRIVEMGKHFRKDSSYDSFLSENAEKMHELASQLIERHGIIVAERDGSLIGMLGFLIHSHFISGDMVAGEVFWWVEPDSRGDGLRLLREMEKRARLAGAKYMQMVAPNAKVANLYQRLGYEFVESTYQRAL